MLTSIFRWMDDLFERWEEEWNKKYPPKQSYKVTPEYILDKYRHYRGEVLPPIPEKHAVRRTVIIRKI